MAEDGSTGLDEADQSTMDTAGAGTDGSSSDVQDGGDSSAQDAGDGEESGNAGSDSTDSSTDSTDGSVDGTDGPGEATDGSGDATDGSGGTDGSGDATDGSGGATDGSGDATDVSGETTGDSGDSSGDVTGDSGEATDDSGDATDGSGDTTDGAEATDGSGDTTDGSGGDAGQDQGSDTGAPDASAGGQPAGTGSGSVAADTGPPYLIVDQYPGDSGARPPWETLVSTAGMCGVILKAWDGQHYDDRGWFAANWPAVRDVGGDRYGVSWFRGAYLFVQFGVGGTTQADAYLSAVDRAGGWDRGDIVPIIDVELGNAANPHNTNAKASAQQIVDCATQCAQRIKSVTGSRVMLYGRGAMRDRGITSHMGCDLVWNPSYTAKMVTNGLQTWPLEDIALWQYCGDNTSALSGYPHSVPGFAKVDISVYVHGAAKPTLDMLRTSLLR